MSELVEVTVRFDPPVTTADLRDRFQELADGIEEAASQLPESTHAQGARSQPNVDGDATDD